MNVHKKLRNHRRNRKGRNGHLHIVSISYKYSHTQPCLIHPSPKQALHTFVVMATRYLALVLAILFVPMVITAHAHSHHHDHKNMTSPFAFIKHLKGCHKGNKTQGIRDLKLYLEHFGYLNYNASGDLTHADDDDFDSLLESAVKTYQHNYHLKPTGTLDAKTVSAMSRPRCGVADIVNGTNWMGKGDHSHGRGLRSFHSVSHYSFFDGRPRWPASKSHLTYAFFPNTPQQAMEPVARAFATWSGNTHFRFSRVSSTASSDIKIGFGRLEHGDRYPFDGRGGTIAHAFAPTRGLFHYDADEEWSVGSVPGRFDLETVALHEIGHLLGLGHSSVQGAIMFPSISPGTTKGLHGDDVQGIKALYNA
ncbi:hypothetical protein MLD38_026109 [Melastoma candidum]|uniref:Uncharacterized protein n=1 Tax=Melastoma candidum TaxID=119954 RepID=A0ACB9P115_9MYRT|nr:hypothetical protein MLD38_026109 [Melastoma candidum]